MSVENEIMATLEEYADAYCAKDTPRLMALFAEGDDISIIGTGTDELCSGVKQIEALFERNFAEATATQFEWHWQKITVRSTTGIAAVSLTIHLKVDEQDLQVPIRWTVGLAKIEGQWQWLHRHASSAAGGQDEGAAYPTKGN